MRTGIPIQTMRKKMRTGFPTQKVWENENRYSYPEGVGK